MQSENERGEWLQVRMDTDEKKILSELASAYGLDMSTFVREAIRFMDHERPVIEIRPRVKNDAENASH